MNELIKAEPFLGTLALDPTLRGILGAISQSLEGVRLKKTTLEDMRPAVVAIADALEKRRAGPASRLLLAPADFRARAGAVGSSAIRQHPARSQLRRPRARRPGDQGDPSHDRETGPDAGQWREGAAHRIGRPVGRGILHHRRWSGAERGDDDPRRSPDPVAGAQAGADHSCRPDQSRGRLELHRRRRPVDGRRAQSHLRRLRRAVHRPWRRFRHSVQRPIPRRALRGPRSPRGSRTHRPRRGGAASAGGGLDRSRFLLVPADRLCGSVRARAASPEPA